MSKWHVNRGPGGWRLVGALRRWRVSGNGEKGSGMVYESKDQTVCFARHKTK